MSGEKAEKPRTLRELVQEAFGKGVAIDALTERLEKLERDVEALQKRGGK